MYILTISAYPLNQKKKKKKNERVVVGENPLYRWYCGFSATHSHLCRGR
jgi:predicted AAA+ superfamily ATPase